VSVSARPEALVVDVDGVDGARVVQLEDVVGCLQDLRRLQPLVGAVIGGGRVQLLDWSVQELGAGAGGNPTTGGLFRVAGTATTGQVHDTWSMVLKVLRSPRETGEPWDDPADGIYWRREMNLVETGLLDSITGLAAPRCLAVSYVSADMCWLWMEDVGSFDRDRWGLSQYRMLAQALARFHAPYLTGTPVPDLPWMNHAFLRGFHAYCKPFFDRLSPTIESTGGLLAQLDPASTDSEVAPLMRILVDPEPWLALADELPQTLCHQDAHIDNLTWRDGPDDGEVVAIDWQMLGPGSIGSDLDQLLCEVPSTLAGQPRHAVVESVLRDYHQELSALGVPVSWGQVRLAFAVDSVLRQGMWKLYLLCEELEGPAKNDAVAQEDRVKAFLREVGHRHLPALVEQLRSERPR
jgi:hypothetical protein